MAWRGLHLTQPARLSLADGQLVVNQDSGVVRLALEDVAWIVLDTQQTSLTGALLAACMEAGIAIIVSDDKHMPNGIALPFHRYFRQGETARRQIEIGAPLAKRLWQAIVVRKIENQAAILYACKAEGMAPLKAMARLVGSGDPDNVEARAARHYWGHLFEDFRRDDDSDRRNKLLNYGYAVVRAAIARGIVAVGLLPALGLKHASVSNAFNLADDLMEPFRPFVDRLAQKLAVQPKRAGMTSPWRIAAPWPACCSCRPSTAMKPSRFWWPANAAPHLWPAPLNTTRLNYCRCRRRLHDHEGRPHLVAFRFLRPARRHQTGAPRRQ